jgi:hypothetical protein
MVCAFFQKEVSANGRAQASAPTKLGIRPLAPGKRAAFFFSKSDQICFRISSLDFMDYRTGKKLRL